MLSYIFVLWAITPLVNRRFYFAIPICFLWLLSCIPLLSRRSEWNRLNLYVVLSIAFWVFWELACRILGISTASIGNYAVRLCFWFSAIITIFYLNNKDFKHLKNLGLWATIVTVFNAIDNIRLYHKYPHLVSGEITQIDQSGIDLKNNIAFTSFSIVSVILALIFLSMYLKTKNSNIKVLLLISFSILFILNMVMSRGASTIILVLGILIFLLSNILEKFNVRSRYVLSVGIAILLLLGYLYINTNVNFVVSHIPNQRIAVRIKDMLTHNQSSSFMSRIICLKISWKTFSSNIHNFVFGIGYHTIPVWTRENAAAVGIGFHTSIVDLLAKYGIIGAIAVSNILFSYYRVCKQYICADFIVHVNILIILLVIYNLLANSITVDMGVIIFIVLPVYSRLLRKDYNVSKDNPYN